MKIVAICGEPATGKTTLMREIIKEGEWETGKSGTLLYLSQGQDLFVLGTYQGKTFDGTDRLSMAVIDDAEKFIIQHNTPGTVILFEGDRLWCDRMVKTIITLGAEFLLLRLFNSNEARFNRWSERHKNGEAQTAEFLKGRKTKYDNLCAKFPFIRRLRNDTSEDMEHNLELIQNFIQGKQE